MWVAEFETFRVKLGKEDLAREWVSVLAARNEECVATLAREKMLIESIFVTEDGGRLFLSWFSIQGPGGESVDTSAHEIDIIHCKYWDECIDTTYKQQQYKHEITFSLPNINQAMMQAFESE